MTLIKLKILFYMIIGAFNEWNNSVRKADPYKRICCDGNMCGCRGSLNIDLWENYK